MVLGSSTPGLCRVWPPPWLLSQAGVVCGFPGTQYKLLVDLPFWDLEDGGPLFTATLGSALVGSPCEGCYPTSPFCTALAEVLHKGFNFATEFCLDIQAFLYML